MTSETRPGDTGREIGRSRPACPPEVLAQIGDLELVARIVVEGLVSGLHRSPFHGYSAEFSQYRHYRPGDDLKYVDWKLLARTDRLHTKQFRETTNTTAQIVLDTSGSMGFPAHLPKLRYAIIVAAALAHLVSAQGDGVGFTSVRDGEPVFVPARGGRYHLRRVLTMLSGIEAGGTWPAADTIRRAAERMPSRGLLLVFSDFYDAEDRTAAELRRASRMGHEVALFHVMSRAELDFPYRRDVEFTDVETGRTRAVNGALARRAYQDAISAFLERWRVRAGSEGLDYSLLVTDTPPDRSLRTFLFRRRR
jgi:uncharacterized protein (DUF58 family)